MVYFIFQRLIQNSCRKGKLIFFMYRCETTSVIKTNNDMQQAWEKKMKFYMKTYEDLFGITKLTEIHDRVTEIQTHLLNVQDKRRKVQEEIFMVEKKLQEAQAIMNKTPFGDDTYISVVTQVHELLKEQRRLQDIFSRYDQAEREHQTALAVAINISQDHEKTYREKNKYLSLITGIIGGILGIVGSSVNNWRHRKDIKHFATDISDQVIDLKKSVEKLKVVVSADGTVLNSASDQIVEAEDLLSSIKSQHEVLDKSIKSLQTLVEMNGNQNVDARQDGDIKEFLNGFEKNIESKLNRQSYINLSLLGSCTLFSLIMFYIARGS